LRAKGTSAAAPPAVTSEEGDEPDDFGLSEKFFERPRQPADTLPTVDEPPSEMFVSDGQEAGSRRRTFLIILICLVAPALVALAVWMWQQRTVGDSGAIPAPPSAPPQEVPVSTNTNSSTSPAPPPPDQIVAADTPSQTFEVGVALFAGYERANRLAVSLAASGFRAITRPLETVNGRMFEVRTGPYLTREAAETDAELIRKLPGYADARVLSTSTTASAAPATTAPATSTPVAAVPSPAPVPASSTPPQTAPPPTAP
jgi:cell division septation protein DedD